MKKMIVMAGPCLIENEPMFHDVVKALKKMTKDLPIELICKGSYKKANRTKGDSIMFTDIPQALTALQKIKFECQSMADVHETVEVSTVSHFVDVLQIPAFLCRQTELIWETAKTGRDIHIKKGQFASVSDMLEAVAKVRQHNTRGIVYITERGTTFGYDDLVVDMRNIMELKHRLPNPEKNKVIIDVTHSLGKHAGSPQHIIALARSGIAAGADGIFFETHPDPKKALSDSTRVVSYDNAELIIKESLKIWRALNR